MKIIQYLINGISIGSVYAIIALGYTMVYGIAKMLNFAHGDIIMVGAYISFCVTNYLGLPVVVSILAAMAVCTVLGMLIEALAYKPLRGTPSLAVLITAIGVSYFLQNAAQLIWSSSPKNYTSIVTFQPLRLFDGQLVITGEVIVTIIASVIIMVGLTWFTGSTPLRRGIPPPTWCGKRNFRRSAASASSARGRRPAPVRRARRNARSRTPPARAGSAPPSSRGAH